MSQGTRNGLDVLTQEYWKQLHSLVERASYDNVSLASPELGLLWNCGQSDMEGGNVYLSLQYKDYVDSNYK